MIITKPASELQKGDMFSTDGYVVDSVAQLVDGRISVETLSHEDGDFHTKRALLDPDFPCPIWVQS